MGNVIEMFAPHTLQPATECPTRSTPSVQIETAVVSVIAGLDELTTKVQKLDRQIVRFDELIISLPENDLRNMLQQHAKEQRSVLAHASQTLKRELNELRTSTAGYR